MGCLQEVGLFESEAGMDCFFDYDGDVIRVALDDVEVLLPALLGGTDFLKLGLLRADAGDRLEQVHIIINYFHSSQSYYYFHSSQSYYSLFTFI